MPLLAYAAETWTTINTNERSPSVFKRKILHRIYGPVCEGGQWHKKYNGELEELYSEPNIVNVINPANWGGQAMLCKLMKTNYLKRHNG